MTSKDYCSRIDGTCPHKISTTKNTCFIMMSYNELFSENIEKMLKRIVENYLKLTPILAKDIRHTGSTDMFCTKVCRPIKESTYCIADFTYENSDVGFETSIAHNCKKPVIITRYIPQLENLTEVQKTLLEEIRKKGIIQYSMVPNKIDDSDIQGIFRIDYSTEKELKQKLLSNFKIKSSTHR